MVDTMDEQEMNEVDAIKTDKGRDVERRCMHMMGGRLCLCQFLGWIDSPQYHCHPQTPFVGMMPQKTKKIEKGKVSNAMNLDIADYIDIYDDGDNDENEEFHGYAANNDMSQYYDKIGPQIKLEDVKEEEDEKMDEFQARYNEYGDNYDYEQEEYVEDENYECIEDDYREAVKIRVL